MGSARTTDEMASLTRDDFASALGGAMEYHPTGGTCSHARCKEDAPSVKIGGSLVKLPCSKHAEQERQAEIEQERAAAAAACLLGSGMTERMRPWSFETYVLACDEGAGREPLDRNALAVAQRWVKTYVDTGAARNLLLWGPVGCGKTGLAWCIVREICETGTQAKIANFKHLLEAIKDCYARKIPTTHAMACHRVPVLVLDDLGAERPTEWACGELLGIVDHRYERGLPTIYVSNFTPSDLARRLGRDDDVTGRRIVSRMTEGATKHEFVGGDRRLAA